MDSFTAIEGLEKIVATLIGLVLLAMFYFKLNNFITKNPLKDLSYTVNNYIFEGRKFWLLTIGVLLHIAEAVQAASLGVDTGLNVSARIITHLGIAFVGIVASIVLPLEASSLFKSIRNKEISVSIVRVLIVSFVLSLSLIAPYYNVRSVALSNNDLQLFNATLFYWSNSSVYIQSMAPGTQLALSVLIIHLLVMTLEGFYLYIDRVNIGTSTSSSSSSKGNASAAPGTNKFVDNVKYCLSFFYRDQSQIDKYLKTIQNKISATTDDHKKAQMGVQIALLKRKIEDFHTKKKSYDTSKKESESIKLKDEIKKLFRSSPNNGGYGVDLAAPRKK